MTKIGKIVYKYNKSVANESELSKIISEKRMAFVLTTLVEGFHYYVCQLGFIRNKFYCPFKMLARPTNDGFHIYTVHLIF